MPKGKDIHTFVRFGGLDLVRQEGFGKDTFHAPPASRGIYAMPLAFQELFLASSLEQTQPEKFPKLKVCPYPDEDDPEYDAIVKEREEFDWEGHSKKREKVWKSLRKVFTKKDGNVWHHLGKFTDNADVIARHNSWVKTTIEAWGRALEKSSLRDRYGDGRWGRTESINEAKGVTGDYSKDHYEVFFDEKVS